MIPAHRSPEILNYRPAFARYPPDVVDGLGRIERAAAIVETLPLLPALERELRRDALVGTIHYSNELEGSVLPIAELVRAASESLDPQTKIQLEVVNYVRALRWIDECLDAGEHPYSSDFLLGIHGVLTSGLGREDARFKPHHEGAWRDGIAVVADSLGSVFHRAVGPDLVPGEMEDRFAWARSVRGRPTDYPGAVLAGVMHYEITDVHPFADYNGRAARLFTQAVLRFEGVLRQKFFSLERHYSEDKEAYFEALRSVRRNTRNMEKWLAYFVDGLAVEMERTAERVRSLNRQLGVALGGAQVRLTAAQERIVARLLDSPGDTTISRADAQEIAEIGLSQAKSELRALVKADIVQVVGAGPAVRYRLAHRASSLPRRASRWTDEEIRRALLELTADDPGRFPSRARFAAEGRLDLYQAMSRAGGIRRWREELGLTHR